MFKKKGEKDLRKEKEQNKKVRETFPFPQEIHRKCLLFLQQENIFRKLDGRGLHF